jgi:mono/diheme cytochrome c family protein
MRCIVLLGSLVFVFPAPGTGAEPAPPPRAVVDYAREVRPILAKNCVACHGPDKQRGGLRLDRKTDALKGGDSGQLIVPGKPAESLLLKKLTTADVSDRMPKGREPLSAADVRTLTAWIEAGAPWPTEAATDGPHWAFQPVKRPAPPQIRNAKADVRNDIDRFVVAKLSDNGLSPAPEADRRTLIRRLKFDLLGLPPTPEEVEAFVNDTGANAYEKLVEKYLASPHYGERWARHWLDAVRFAETHGFEMNQPRPTAYHYRDYVIKALNDDEPYDRFVAEQLAGDALETDAATGFLVGGAWDAVKSPDPVLTANQRADELHDIIGTTGATFLGLTIACSRCHAHKFDPIPQLDYYRLKAVFAGVQHGERAVRTGDEAQRRVRAQKLRAELDDVESKRASMEPLANPAATEVRRPAVNPLLNTERFKPVKAKFVRFVIFEANQFEPCVDELEVFTSGPKPVNVALASAGAKATSAGDYPPSNIHRLEFVNDGKYGNGRSWISNKVGRGRVEIELAEVSSIDRVVWGRDREGKYTDRLPTCYRIDVSLDRDAWSVVASSDDRAAFDGAADPIPPGLTVAERAKWVKLAQEASDLRKQMTELNRGSMAYAGRMSAPEVTHRLHRGDATQKKEVVGPGVLSEIGPTFAIPATATDPERRLALARWITDPANPLTARVIVNRLWQHHFGAGIVDTPSDFGKNGGKPTHPELLDWLASELVEKKWSLKHVHRLIVTSATYRQSSALRAGAFAKDAQARLLWRYPPRRIEAEALRDAILFVSGKLDLTMGGPGFDLFEKNTNYVKVYTPKKEFTPAEFRRMIYQQKPRMQLDDTFGAFDCPDAGQIAPRRNVSTTPLQALNLLNSSFVLQQAGYFAQRVEKDAGKDVAAQVKRTFALAFQREPSEKELTAATKLVKAHGLSALCRAVLNANEFVFLD